MLALPADQLGGFRHALNHFTMESEGDESLFLDGQTDALTLSLRYGLPQQWDVE